MPLLSRMILLVLLAGCTTKPAKLSQEDNDRIRLEAETMLTEYNKAIESGGLLAEFDYLDSSSRFTWFPPGFNVWISYDSVSAILKYNAGKFKSISNTWDTLKIEPLTTELAAYSGVLTSESEDTSGNKTKVRLKETGTLIKRGNRWKLLTGQTAILDSN